MNQILLCNTFCSCLHLFFCRTFSQQCHNIEFLNLSGCKKITDLWVFCFTFHHTARRNLLHVLWKKSVIWWSRECFPAKNSHQEIWRRHVCANPSGNISMKHIAIHALCKFQGGIGAEAFCFFVGRTITYFSILEHARVWELTVCGYHTSTWTRVSV